jgi:hypothetical protein
MRFFWNISPSTILGGGERGVNAEYYSFLSIILDNGEKEKAV